MTDPVRLEKSHLVAWDDPRAWGFCRGCAFVEPVDIFTGKILPHSRMTGVTGYQDQAGEYPCSLSGTFPEEQPGPEAHPAHSAGWKDPKVNLEPEAAHGLEPEHTD